MTLLPFQENFLFVEATVCSSLQRVGRPSYTACNYTLVEKLLYTGRPPGVVQTSPTVAFLGKEQEKITIKHPAGL